MATEDKKMNAESVNPTDNCETSNDSYAQDAASSELTEDRKQELLKELVEERNIIKSQR